MGTLEPSTPAFPNSLPITPPQHFTLPLELIRRDQIAHANLRAQRPEDMSLDNTKARNMLGRKLGCLDEYLAALRSQEEHGRRLELLHAASP